MQICRPAEAQGGLCGGKVLSLDCGRLGEAVLCSQRFGASWSGQQGKMQSLRPSKETTSSCSVLEMSPVFSQREINSQVCVHASPSKGKGITEVLLCSPHYWLKGRLGQPPTSPLWPPDSQSFFGGGKQFHLCLRGEGMPLLHQPFLA